jgi:hypothetical protein
VGLTIAAHLELYHLTVLFELGQNIFIKFPEMQNRPGIICTASYDKSMFNTRVMLLKIAMESKSKKERERERAREKRKKKKRKENLPLPLHRVCNTS